MEKAGADAPAFVVPRGLHRSRLLLHNHLPVIFGRIEGKAFPAR